MAKLLSRTAATIAGASLALAIASLGFSPRDARAAEKTPTAQQILDTYVEKTGGLAAYDKLQNSVTKLTLTIPAAGISVDVTVYSARPNKLYTVAESPAVGKNERGTDGKVYWEKSSMQGTRILEGDELAEALREAAFEGLVYWRQRYDSVAVAGVDTVSGDPCYEVVMKAKGARARTLSFDEKTGLLRESKSIVATQMGDLPMESFPSDYRKVDGVLQAFKTTIKVMGQERTMDVKSIEYNVAIPDSIFAVPADVQALLEKK
jgi:hypothetical protein